MSPNRRIFLNIVTTYGRSLYALVAGLICGRWALMALGEVDYGLMSVVGGLTVFISFLNSLFGSAVGRFYGIALGHSKMIGDGGVEECRHWFSVAILIHILVPFSLMAIGYPVGEWVVRCFLTIPTERIDACVWVFRFVCLSCFVSMISVPFVAMYTMKQYIAELTMYSFATYTLNLMFLRYMVTHQDFWLVKYALWTCLLAILPHIIISLRARTLFPECRFRWRYALDIQRLRQIVAYAGWTAFGGFANVLKNQGNAVLVNKYFGPAVNAAMGIANTVNAHALSLTNSIQSAMSPVITTAVGAGDFEMVRRLALRFCKVSMLVALVFMLPLSLELPGIMRFWLKNPPAYVTGLCWFMLAISFVDKQTLGHGMAIMAYGRLKWYQIVLGLFNMLSLPLAWLFCANGRNVYWVGAALLITWSLVVYGRVFFARRLLGMDIVSWLRGILIPIYAVTAIGIVFGMLPRLFYPQTLQRVFITTLIAESVCLPMAWMIVLDREERCFVVSRVKRLWLKAERRIAKHG